MTITENQLDRINHLRERVGSNPVTMQTAEILLDEMGHQGREDVMRRVGIDWEINEVLKIAANEPKPASAAIVTLRDDCQRQLDLIRYSRHALHTDGLITNEEYSELLRMPGAVARLGSYDDAIANAGASTASAVAAERERCAKIAEDEKCSDDTGTCCDIAYNSACDHIAAKIRSGA